MINPQKAVEWYKQNYKHGIVGLSDYDIYERLKKSYSNYEYPENPFKQRTQSLGRPRTPQDVEEETEQGYLGKLSLMSLPELWADDHEWAARAYNNSLAGTIYQIANGKPKYQVEGESSGVAEDIGAFFLGLASPVDILTFIGSGMGGGYVAGKTAGTAGFKTIAGKVLKDNMAKEITEQAALRTASQSGINKFLGKHFSKKGAIESGVSLATYGTAAGALQNAAMQRTQILDPTHERESFDLWENTWEATKHGLWSGATGAAGGFITKGKMMPKLAKAKLATDATWQAAARRMAYGNFSQINAEAAVFTGGHLAQMAVAGEDIDLDTVVGSYFTNLGIIGGLKTGMSLMKKSGGDIKQYNDLKKNLYKDLDRRQKMLDFKQPYIGTEKISMESVGGRKGVLDAETLEIMQLFEAERIARKNGDIHTANILAETSGKLESNVNNKAEAVKLLGEKTKRFDKLINKFENEPIDKWTAKEKSEFLMLTAELNLEKARIVREKLENPELIYQENAKLFNKKPNQLTDIEKSKLISKTQKELLDLENFGNTLNVTSVKGSIAEQNKAFKKSFKLEERLNKDGTFDIDVFDNNGTRLKIDYLKGVPKEKIKQYKKFFTEEILEKAIDGEAPSIALDPNAPRTYVLTDKKGVIQTYDRIPVEQGGKPITDIMTPAEAAGPRGQGYREFIQDGINISDSSKSSKQTSKNIQDNINKVTTSKPELEIERADVKESLKAPDSKYTKPNLGKIDGKQNVYNYAREQLGEGTSHYHDALYGFWKHMRNRKSGNTPGHYKTLIDYFKFLQKEGFRVDEAKQDLTTRFVNENNMSANQSKKTNDALSAFYGGGDYGATKLFDGFAYDFMFNERTGRVPSIAVLGKGVGTSAPASKQRIAGASPKEYEKFKSSKVDILYKDGKYTLEDGTRIEILNREIAFGERKIDGSLKKGAVTFRTEQIDAAIDLLYATGARGVDVIRRLKISDIDWTDGTIKVFSTGKGLKGAAGDRIDFPLRLYSPELWAKFEKAVIGRDKLSKELLFANNKGKAYSSDKFNSMLKLFMPEGITLYGKKGRFTISDFRKMIETDADGTIFQTFVDTKLVGHKAGSTRIRYVQSDMVMFEQFAKFRKYLAEGKTKREAENLAQTEFLRSIEKGAPEDVLKNRSKYWQEKYPEFGIKIVESFEKYGVPKDVVGFIHDNNIRILKNKAPAWAIGHEVAHGVFKILRAFRDLAEKKGLPDKFNDKAHKKSIQLIKEAERIFKKDGKFNEEYAISNIDKVMDKMIDNPMATKVKSWMKRFNMFIKDIFGIKYNKEEVAWALGEKILSKEGIPQTNTSLSERMKYLTMKDFASPQDYVKAVKLDFNTIAEKFEMTGAEAEKGLTRIIVQAANFTEKGKFLESSKISESDFKIGLKKNYTAESLENLERFHAAMKTLNLDKLSKKRSMLKWIGEYREVENIRVYQKNITEAKQKEMLKSIGVPEGNINNASLVELQMYKKHLNMLVDVEQKRVSWFDDADTQAFLNTDTKNVIKKYLEEGVRFAAPVHEALRHMGLEKIADKLNTHESVIERYVGQWKEFEKQAERAVGVNNFHGKIKKRGIRDDLWVLDNNGEILLEDIYMWKNKVSAKERKRIQSGEDFFRKAVNDKWWTTVKDNKKGDNLKKIVNGEYIYLRKGSDGKLTPEAMVVKENIKLMDWFASELKEAVKFNLNEAAYEKWLSDTDLRMMEKGTYMTRAFTKKAKELFTSNDAYMQGVLKDLQSKFAVQLAEKKYGKNYTTENLTTQAIQTQAKGLAAQTFLNMQTYSVSKFGAKNLKTRMPKRENYKLNEDTGKYDRIYQRDYTDLTKSYVYGMSRFLANLKIFPELTSLDGFQITGVKEQLAILSGLSGEMAQKGQWVKKVIEKQVGLGEYDAPFELSFKNLESWTRKLAKVGLSFPTSGVKNVLVGGVQTAFAYDVADIGRGFADIIRRDSQLMTKARKTGATETGMRIYEGTRAEQVFDKLSFDWSFMKSSEKLNRYFNVLVGKHDQVKLIEYMRTYPESHRLHKKALARLKGFYLLNEKDISMLKKYGNLENVKGAKIKDLYAKNNLINQFKMLEQKMNHAAHVNTQGSSADIYMPSFAGSRGVRPLTLYKRMAYAATDNTRRSLSVAKAEAKAGNVSGIIKPLMGLTATYISGRAMIEMYSSLFGQEMPKENSGFWRQFATVLWKGEFLGLMSEFLSPYHTKEIGNGYVADVAWNTVKPAILSTAHDGLTLVGQVTTGKTFLTGRGQGLDTFFKNQFSLYNGVRKTLDNKNNNFKVRSKEFGKMYSQFEKEVYKKPNMEFEKTIRSPHYKYLRNSFMTGTPEEFTKAYFATQIAVAHSFLRENKASTIDEAFLKASRELEKQIKAINPNRASFLKDTKDKRKPIRWMQWLSKHPDAKNIVPELEKLERDYLIKIAKIQKEMPYHARKFKIANMFKQYNWKLPTIK